MYDKSMKVSELSHSKQLMVKTNNQNASPAWQSETLSRRGFCIHKMIIMNETTV